MHIQEEAFQKQQAIEQAAVDAFGTNTTSCPPARLSSITRAVLPPRDAVLADADSAALVPLSPFPCRKTVPRRTVTIAHNRTAGS